MKEYVNWHAVISLIGSSLNFYKATFLTCFYENNINLNLYFLYLHFIYKIVSLNYNFKIIVVVAFNQKIPMYFNEAAFFFRLRQIINTKKEEKS